MSESSPLASNTKAQVYVPVPTPGWPSELVSLKDYHDALREIERLTREKAHHLEERLNAGKAMQEAINAAAVAEEQSDRLRAALLELVQCKALREKIDGELSACHQEMSPQLQAMENEYQLRKPLAWRDARAALSGEHRHTDACWEPDSGCDMGRSEQHAQPATDVERSQINSAFSGEPSSPLETSERSVPGRDGWRAFHRAVALWSAHSRIDRCTDVTALNKILFEHNPDSTEKEPEASERCHFRAFGALPCEKPKGHADDHLCRWPAETRDDWLPIGTVPDPQITPVLGAVPRDDGAFAVGEMHETEQGWYWAGNDPTDSWGGQIYPAYWQPLPEPPNSAEKAGEEHGS